MLYVIPGGACTPPPAPAATVVTLNVSPRLESVWFTLMMVGVLATVSTAMLGAGLTLHHLGSGRVLAALSTSVLTAVVSVAVFRVSTWVLDRATGWCLR